jgi:transglutaminase/protease-like cytokinesis protein 3
MKRKKSQLDSGITYTRKFYKTTLPALLALPFLLVCTFVLTMEAAAQFKPAANSSDFRSDKNYDYSAIDRYALKAPSSSESSIPSLASYLFKTAENDKEKVRAIFRWITSRISYDTAAFFSGSYVDTSPAGVLRSRSSICMGYAGLFKALCDHADIECVIINGYAKGYGYRVGDRIGGRTNHSWNAVNINGKWRLVDPTWGAGYLDSRGKFLKKYEEFYFFTPPHFFLTGHLPASSQWQFLDKPITAKQYAELPKLKPQFFKLGFNLDNLSHKKIEIQTGKRLDVRLKSNRPVALIANIEDGRGQEVPDTTLVRLSSGEVTVSAVFKRSGEYILRIYGKQKIEKKKYLHIVSYKIYAKVKKPNARACYPKTFNSYSTKDAYLFSPLRGYLKIGRDYTFRIKLPGAQRVAVVAGKKWNHLKQEGIGIFEGRFTAERKIIEIYAQYPGKENYTAIIRYTGY